jgi:hypothetical protein
VDCPTAATSIHSHHHRLDPEAAEFVPCAKQNMYTNTTGDARDGISHPIRQPTWTWNATTTQLGDAKLVDTMPAPDSSRHNSTRIQAPYDCHERYSPLRVEAAFNLAHKPNPRARRQVSRLYDAHPRRWRRQGKAIDEHIIGRDIGGLNYRTERCCLGPVERWRLLRWLSEQHDLAGKYEPVDLDGQRAYSR